MKKRVLAIWLVAALLACLLPSAALAAPDSGGSLTVNGVVIYGAGATTPPTGAAYEQASNTLTLTNYAGGAIAANQMGDDFTIRLVGRNTVTGDASVACGIYVQNGSLTITGGGSLDVTGGTNTAVLGASYGIRCNGTRECLTVRSCTVRATGADIGPSFGISAQNVLIKGGNVTAKGGRGNQSFGFECVDMTVENGTLRCESGQAQNLSCGVSLMAQCRITVHGGDVTAIAGSAANSYGIYNINVNPSLEITGGSLVAAGDSEAMTFAPTTGGYTALHTEMAGYNKGGNPLVPFQATDLADYKYYRIGPPVPVADAAPKTGDAATPWLWAGLILLAGAGLIVLRRRRQA